MAHSLADNAIALLIDLAERGEIDPWDVQVIDVIDRFLSQIKPTPNQTQGSSPYEADLSESGQAFLYAAMLVLLKADSLARLDEPEEEEVPDFDPDLLGLDVAPPLPPRLEKQIRRRAVASPPKNRRVTLQELITQLEIIAAAMSSNPGRSRVKRAARPQSRSQAVRSITQLAHQENLSEVAATLEQFFQEHWLELSHDGDWVEFEHLVSFWVRFQHPTDLTVAPSRGDHVGIFWALLLLSAQAKVELQQDTFYGIIQVRSLVNALPLDYSPQTAIAIPE